MSISIPETRTFQTATNYGTLGSPGSIVVADINGDGKPDLVVSVPPVFQFCSMSATEHF